MAHSITRPLSNDEIDKQMERLADWHLSADIKSIYRDFNFKGFQKTVLFVNAVAFLASEAAHHPEIEFGFDYCRVTFTTHSANGLTMQDFLSANKVESLLAG